MDTVGLALHERAEAILGRSEYTQDEYLLALTRAAAEAADDGTARRDLPVRELEGRLLAAVTDEILLSEGRQNDPDAFVAVFTDLARRSALYGYEGK
jgi:hypothetical protein